MMALRHVLVIFVLAAFVTLSMQYPANENRLNRAKMTDFLNDYMNYVRMRSDEHEIVKRSCIQLGSSGCGGNNGKCCRAGDPYTGTMRKCVNEGSFSSPDYRCHN